MAKMANLLEKSIRARSTGILLISIWSLLPASVFAQQVPPQLKPPDGEQLLLQVHAKGDQVYTCKGDGAQYTWTLKGPDAQLFDKDGKAFGKHYAGPSWESNDGSKVTAKAAANVPSPDADSIPWLLLSVTSHSGEGVLARVTSIQRLNTKGGKAPSSGCDAAHQGQEIRAPYSADYLFYAPQKSPQAQNFELFNPSSMAKPVAGYSQVAVVNKGKIVYIAGQVALDAQGNFVGKDDFRLQVEQIFKNLQAAVEAAGGTFHDVIKLNYYCAASVDPSQIVAVRETRDKYVNTQNPPASTFAVVSRLVRPEWLIEIEAVAVVPST